MKAVSGSRCRSGAAGAARSSPGPARPARRFSRSLHRLGLVLSLIAALGAACAPQRPRDPGARSATEESAALGPLLQRAETFETALQAFPVVRWTQGQLDWTVVLDGERVLCVRHHMMDDGDSTDVDYYYEDGALFACRRRTRFDPQKAPGRSEITEQLFYENGRLIAMQVRADGLPVPMHQAHREWLGKTTHEGGTQALVDARKRVAK
jgi:hypothetical protein